MPRTTALGEWNGVSYIEWVCAHGLCTGCGTCAAACPSDALRMEITSDGVYRPVVFRHLCSDCGMCGNVCPGYRWTAWNSDERAFSGEPTIPGAGEYGQPYVGFAQDEAVRAKGTSGGVVTAILLEALRSKRVSGALVTTMDPNNPLWTRAFLARTEDELLSATKSKYCPVHFGEALKEIRESTGQYAVVGLPCHIAGVRKLQALHRDFREKIGLCLALFCGHGVSYHFTRFLLERVGIDVRDVTAIEYRSGGWWNYGILVALRGGETEFLPRHPWNRSLFGMLWSSKLFTPKRCLLCSDFVGGLADVSLGDAWLEEYRTEDHGMSMILAGTEAGQAFLRHCERTAALHLEPISLDKVLEAQSGPIRFKQVTLPNRLLATRLLLGKVPALEIEAKGVQWGHLLAALILMVSTPLASMLYRLGILEHVPVNVFRRYLRFTMRWT